MDVIFTFVEEQSIDSGTMDGWYGWIEFADFSVIYDNDADSDYYNAYNMFLWVEEGTNDGFDPAEDFFWASPEVPGEFDDYFLEDEKFIMITEPDITAKITNGTFYIVLYEAPEFDPDHVEAVEDDEDDDYVVEDDESDPGYVEPDLSQFGGITIGYDTDAFDVELYVASGDGYDMTSTNEQWLFGFNVGVSAAGAELSADFALASNVDDNAMIFGADASYTLDAGMVAIAPYVGFDYWASDVVDPGIWELGAGLDATFTNDDAINVAANYPDTGDLDLEVTVTEDGEAGFIPGLNLEVMFGAYEQFADWRINAFLSYLIGDILPYAEVDYDSLENIMVDVGVEYLGLANTTIWVEWEAHDLDKSDATVPDSGYLWMGAKVEL